MGNCSEDDPTKTRNLVSTANLRLGATQLTMKPVKWAAAQSHNAAKDRMPRLRIHVGLRPSNGPRLSGAAAVCRCVRRQFWPVTHGRLVDDNELTSCPSRRERRLSAFENGSFLWVHHPAKRQKIDTWRDDPSSERQRLGSTCANYVRKRRMVGI
jgi:hypothetical protein